MLEIYFRFYDDSVLLWLIEWLRFYFRFPTLGDLEISVLKPWRVLSPECAKSQGSCTLI
jgi:hypothetical protein